MKTQQLKPSMLEKKPADLPMPTETTLADAPSNLQASSSKAVLTEAWPYTLQPNDPLLWAKALANQLLALPQSTTWGLLGAVNVDGSADVKENEQHSTNQHMAQSMVHLASLIEEGHTCMPCAAISHPSVADVSSAQSITASQPFEQTQDLAPQQTKPLQTKPLIWDSGFLYFYRHWQQEAQLAKAIVRLYGNQLPAVIPNPVWLQGLNTQQAQALNLACSQALCLITGGPGTGKTYTLAKIILTLLQSNSHLKIALAAPTGKAAQRMQQALGNQLTIFSQSSETTANNTESNTSAQTDLKQTDLQNNIQHIQSAKTIHRLLGMGQNMQPQFDAQNPLPYDVLVIDEASMIDLELASLLFNSIGNHTRVILLGDVHQLAAVEAGAVLSDLQKLPLLAGRRVHLTQSQRFNDQSAVGQLAHATLHNDAPAVQKLLNAASSYVLKQPDVTWFNLNKDDYKVDVVDAAAKLSANKLSHTAFAELAYQQLWQGYIAYAHSIKTQLLPAINAGLLPVRQANNHVFWQPILQHLDQYRILCAQHRGLWGTKAINHSMSKHFVHYVWGQTPQINPVFVGLPIMVRKNDPINQLSNGEIGIVFELNEDAAIDEATQLTATLNVNNTTSKTWAVYFSHLAYAVPLARLAADAFEPAFAMTIHKSQGSEFEQVAIVLGDSAHKLLSRELVYTAITRSKKFVKLYCKQEDLMSAIAQPTVRYTGLTTKVQRLLNSPVLNME